MHHWACTTFFYIVLVGAVINSIAKLIGVTIKNKSSDITGKGTDRTSMYYEVTDYMFAGRGNAHVPFSIVWFDSNR